MNIVFVVCKLETGGVWDTVSVWNNCRFVCFADLFAKSSLDPGVANHDEIHMRCSVKICLHFFQHDVTSNFPKIFVT